MFQNLASLCFDVLTREIRKWVMIRGTPAARGVQSRRVSERGGASLNLHFDGAATLPSLLSVFLSSSFRSIKTDDRLIHDNSVSLLLPPAVSFASILISHDHRLML